MGRKQHPKATRQGMSHLPPTRPPTPSHKMNIYVHIGMGWGGVPAAAQAVVEPTQLPEETPNAPSPPTSKVPTQVQAAHAVALGAPRPGAHSFTVLSPLHDASTSSVGCQDTCHARSVCPLKATASTSEVVVAMVASKYSGSS
jgi:hypothetical protein